MKYFGFILFFLFSFTSVQAQEDEIKLVAADTIDNPINPLAPAKAAFYSAVLPGLGQAYNKSYWKIPVVYVALGTGIYAYSWNKKEYHKYRDAYKQRLLEGTKSTDAYQGILSTDRLVDAQKYHQRYRDLSMLITVGLYALNIIEANVDAHLKQFNVNGKLTVRPDIQQNEFTNKQNMGVALNFRF